MADPQAALATQLRNIETKTGKTLPRAKLPQLLTIRCTRFTPVPRPACGRCTTR